MEQGLSRQEERPLEAARSGFSARYPGAGPAAGNDGVNRRGDVFLPLGYEPGYDYPLLVWLADSGDHRFDLGRTMARLSLRNYLAVRVDDAKPEACWDAIDRMVDRYSVHSRRVYLVGTGTGGTAAFRIACRQPAAFAGAVSIAGRFPLDEGLLSSLAQVRQLPLLLCCTAKPAAVSAPAPADVDRTLRLFHAAGGQFGLRIYPAARSAGGSLARSRAVLRDIDHWVMDAVSRSPVPLTTAAV